MKNTEKFYIVAERYNPQLGTYLSDVFVGAKRVNKTSISCRFDFHGSPKTMRFSLSKYVDSDTGHFYHSPVMFQSCVYGSMYYSGFDTAEEAKAYLETKWSNHHNFEKCMAKLVA